MAMFEIIPVLSTIIVKLAKVASFKNPSGIAGFITKFILIVQNIFGWPFETLKPMRLKYLFRALYVCSCYVLTEVTSTCFTSVLLLQIQYPTNIFRIQKQTP